MKSWNVKQLHNEYKQALAQCQTPSERGMCESIMKRDMINQAKEFLETRKLTPGEISVLNHYGIAHAI
mgnify:CR=1 FL=1